MHVLDVFRELWRSPRDLLLRKWNWKSAVFSSVIRAVTFFFCNLTAGSAAATGAMLTEFAYRAATAGFYGALTQAFRKARPGWAANLAVVLLLPLTSHSIELSIHFLRGTPKLFTSIAASVCFTVISTLFNLYAMRRGALIVGDGSAPVADDMRRIPGLIGGFIAYVPMAVYRRLARAQALVRVGTTALLMVVFLAAAVPSRAESPNDKVHNARAYSASAAVTIMGITVFSRSDVGAGFASLDETVRGADREIHLRFFSGSRPERAHGLNRLGFIEEYVHERNGAPPSIDYFGVMTASRETSIKEARTALETKSAENVSYVAAKGSLRGARLEYAVRHMLLPARYRLDDTADLLQRADASFSAREPEQFHDAGPNETFLHALMQAITSAKPQSDIAYIYNDNTYRLHTDISRDERTGDDLQRSGKECSPYAVMRLKGTIRNGRSGEQTEFRLWFDSSSANALPLRFEFRPRSYLRLVFDAQRPVTSQSVPATALSASPLSRMVVQSDKGTAPSVR